MMWQVNSTSERNSNNHFVLVVLIVIGFLAGQPQCRAQLMSTGSIDGTVSDQSGAVVPGATVVITNVDTKQVTQNVSNSSGSFSQIGLNPGNYQVTVSAPGFNTFRKTGIYLDPAGTSTVNVVLMPGARATTITVTGSQVEVQTSTSEISSTVSGSEAQTLPLNGRNYEQLGSLMPGVINTSPVAALGTGGRTTYSVLAVNGAGGNGSQYGGQIGVTSTLDGIWNSVASVGQMEDIIIPNPDEIAEVKVLQSNYSAKYALLGSSVVIVLTKSGTGSFHGGAWEFLRNTDLNATQYFATAPSVLHQNIFGWNLGGPLFVPHFYNTSRQKTFFYFNQQWVRNTAGSVIRGSSPLATMRGQGTPGNSALFPMTGTFGTAYLKDPAKTGNCNASSQAACFSTDGNGNYVIPVSRIDQNALALLNALAPLPNNPSGGFTNYINTNSGSTQQMDVMSKVDHNITPKLRITGEFFDEGQTNTAPASTRMGSPFPTNYDVFDSNSEAAQVQLTHIISPAMVNQTSISMSFFDFTHDIGGIHLSSQVPNFQQTLPFTGGYLQSYVPRVQFSGGWSQFGTSGQTIQPAAHDLHDAISDDWSWVRGKHIWQAGLNMLFGTERVWIANSAGNTNGAFTFNGQFTGNSIADYLLGDPNAFSQGSNGLRAYIDALIVSPYLEDQWKIARRLTLTAGVRWSYMPWPTQQAGTMVAFVPASFNPNNVPIVSATGVITSTPAYNEANGLVQNGENGIPLNLTNSHKYYVAPDAGFAWDVYGNGQTSIRGGYGITYYMYGEQACTGGGCLSYPAVTSINLINSNFSSPVSKGSPTPPTAFGVGGEDLQNYQAGQVQHYSMSLQQQFGLNWFASIAGAGNITQRALRSPNINQPLPVPGYDFNPLLNTGNYASSYFAPYLGYSSIAYYQSVGKANWNALELSLQHRAGKNLYLTAAYTWSHDLDNLGDVQNPYALAKAYGNSIGNTPQVFTLSLVYSLPLFQDGRRWQRSLLGGWQYSDMTTIQSGSSSTFGMSLAHSGLADRPNQVSPLTYLKQWKTSGSLWFNTGAFAQPAAGFYGNVGNGTFLGPGVNVSNMAAYKKFSLAEAINLEFRAEFFNVFNHTMPQNPNTTFGAGAFGQVTTAKAPRVGEMALKFTF